MLFLAGFCLFDKWGIKKFNKQQKNFYYYEKIPIFAQ